MQRCHEMANCMIESASCPILPNYSKFALYIFTHTIMASTKKRKEPTKNLSTLHSFFSSPSTSGSGSNKSRPLKTPTRPATKVKKENTSQPAKNDIIIIDSDSDCEPPPKAHKSSARSKIQALDEVEVVEIVEHDIPSPPPTKKRKTSGSIFGVPSSILFDTPDVPHNSVSAPSSSILAEHITDTKLPPCEESLVVLEEDEWLDGDEETALLGFADNETIEENQGLDINLPSAPVSIDHTASNCAQYLF